MSFRLRLVLFLFIASGFAFLLTPQRALAQGGATVQGNVIDPDNALIPAANVTLTPVKGNALTALSQSDGTYTFKNVPPGVYSLTASANGFGSFVKLGVRITAGQALTQDIKMTLQEQSQVVQVTANTAQVSVDADSNASSTVIKGKDLEALSDDPDELSSELTALAGPAAGPNGGQIYVDGFTGGQLPPKSSIREIRVNQNPFSAQYDKIGFGRIEVFTKPGTDKLHGNASIQGNDNNFNTSNPFLGSTNVANPYHTIFFLGSLTGPINHKTSFTLSGSRRQIQDNSIINPTSFYASSADSTTLCAPGDLSCSEIPTGYPTAARAVFVPRTRWDISPRIDYALTEKNTLTARYQYESNVIQNDGLGGSTALPTTAYNDSSTESTVQISDSQIVSAKIVNETRFEYQRTTSNQNPVSQAPTVSVQGNFSGGGSSLGAFSTTGSHIEGQNYTSIALSKNFIRFGGRVRYNNENLTSFGGINGTFTYNSLLDPCYAANGTPAVGCANTTTLCSSANATANSGTYFSSYQCGLASQYNITKINQSLIKTDTTDVGLYLEDDWKPKANLSISYGLRYEAQTGIDSAHDLAPRLAISYGIPRKGKNPLTVVRGGFGIFYDRFTLGNLLSTFQNNGTNQITSTLLNPGFACQPNETGTGGTAGCSSGTVISRANINTLAPGLRSSYNIQSQVGMDQQLGRSATLSVNYIHTQGVHQYYSSSIPTATSFLYEYGSGGVFRQNQLFINGNIRAKVGTLFGFYGLSGAKSDTGGASSFLSNPDNPGQDYGRAAFNHKNFAVLGGNGLAPFKISLSPFMIFQGGTPYNVTTGTDVNQDSISNDRPAFQPGATSGSCKDASTFVTPVLGSTYTPIPINYCTAPSVFTFNLRISRTFGFGPKTEAAQAADARAAAGGGRGGRGPGGGGGGGGRGGGGGPFGQVTNTGRKYNLTFGAQGSNIFNVIPYGTPVGQLTSTRFGQSTNIASGPFASGSAVRRITLQATFNF